MSTLFSREEPMEKQNEHKTIQFAKLITISVKPESKVFFVTSKWGSMTIERMKTAKQTQPILPARDIHRFRTNVLSRLLVTSFTEKPVVLHKHFCIALETGPPECIMKPEPIDRLKLTKEANAVHSREVEDRQKKTERHMKVEHEDAERKAHDGIQKVKIDAKLDAHHDIFIGMITEFESMWDGDLGSKASKNIVLN